MTETRKPTELLMWLIPCDLSQVLLLKCALSNTSPSRQAAAFSGIFLPGMLSRTFKVSSQIKKLHKPDSLLKFAERPNLLKVEQ